MSVVAMAEHPALASAMVCGVTGCMQLPSGDRRQPWVLAPGGDAGEATPLGNLQDAETGGRLRGAAQPPTRGWCGSTPVRGRAGSTAVYTRASRPIPVAVVS